MTLCAECERNPSRMVCRACAFALMDDMESRNARTLRRLGALAILVLGAFALLLRWALS